jgi:hypothetical protein
MQRICWHAEAVQAKGPELWEGRNTMGIPWVPCEYSEYPLGTPVSTQSIPWVPPPVVYVPTSADASGCCTQ